MYFPEDMTFQYFFFDTYPGYFLQVQANSYRTGCVIRTIYLLSGGITLPNAAAYADWKYVL